MTLPRAKSRNFLILFKPRACFASMQSQSLRAVARSRARRRRNEFQSGCRPWRVPGLITERTKIAENRHQRQQPRGRNQNRMASAARHQNAFPLHPRKAFSCRGPWPDYFQFSTRAPSFPRAPFRIANRPALDQEAHSRRPTHLSSNLRLAQSDET
jgi:hypothetical protein